MSDIPKDPIILMSWANTMLRDKYESLDALCDDLQLDKNSFITKLAGAGFVYNETTNQFR